jgi:transcriptional regulator with PAS, ATPase and Fis domain
LVKHFLILLESNISMISDEVISAFSNYGWPGNVRELKQTLQFAVLKAHLTGGKSIELNHLPRELSLKKENSTDSDAIKFPLDLNQKLAEVELTYVREALRKLGKKTEAWKILGYSDRFSFRRRVLSALKKYPVLKESFGDLFDLFVTTSSRGN